MIACHRDIVEKIGATRNGLEKSVKKVKNKVFIYILEVLFGTCTTVSAVFGKMYHYISNIFQ